ncbi:MAG TPA: XdhC family protein [Marmoricola sp.]|jgi:xanthine dehydrogenase accessory factor|nr:XdhC family protein [Marmoricola sp.]
MREVLDQLSAWLAAGEDVAVCTVVDTWSSAPRLPGATMIVGPGGVVAGSVSGGCVEGAVYETAQAVLETGQPALERFGVSDDDAFAVGLTCGGILDVYVERWGPRTYADLDRLLAGIETGVPVALATVIDHPDPDRIGAHLVVGASDAVPADRAGTLGSARSDAAIHDDVLGLLATGRTASRTYGPDGERLGTQMRVLVRSFAPRPRLIVFGAIDFAAAVARVGRFLDYRVTVCDARPVFATRARFPDADEVIVRWPHSYLQEEIDGGRIDQRTALAVLTHDPKFDIPLLTTALRHPDLAYIGAMGSRRTHEDRVSKLRANGVTSLQLERLSSPIGLDIGARTPEETAVSIAAELISQRWGGSGRPLGALAGPIHHACEPQSLQRVLEDPAS